MNSSGDITICVVPSYPSEPANATDPRAGQGDTLAPAATARIRWAQLLKRVFAIDIEHCPHCGGTLTIIAAILNPAVIAKILTHLGLPIRAPARSPARPFHPQGAQQGQSLALAFDRLQMA